MTGSGRSRNVGLMGEYGNLIEHFRRVAEGAGDKPFLIEGDAATLTYAELPGRVARLAARLSAFGAAPGERIVVQVEKSRQAVLLYLAALHAGLVYVPLNTAYTAAELAYFIGDAEPALVACRPVDERAVAAIAGAAPVRLMIGRLATAGRRSAAAGSANSTETQAARACVRRVPRVTVCSGARGGGGGGGGSHTVMTGERGRRAAFAAFAAATARSLSPSCAGRGAVRTSQAVRKEGGIDGAGDPEREKRLRARVHAPDSCVAPAPCTSRPRLSG